MKYVLDENMTTKDDDLPDRVINARDLFYNNGFKQTGIEDQKLLALATKEGYIIVTQDRKMVIRANQQNIDIVYALGRGGKKWVWIPKEARVTNGLKLRNFIEPDKILQSDEKTFVKDLSLIPYFMKGR